MITISEVTGLDAATLSIEDVRVVVAGQTIDSDSTSNSGVRTISLDGFTVELLRQYVATLDDERDAFGEGYDTRTASSCATPTVDGCTRTR